MFFILYGILCSFLLAFIVWLQVWLVNGDKKVVFILIIPWSTIDSERMGL